MADERDQGAYMNYESLKEELQPRLTDLKDNAEDENHTYNDQQDLSHSREWKAGEKEDGQNETEYIEDVDRPVVELFVKAGCDKKKNGNCPICHRYFMMFYLLREEGQIDLVVTTFLPRDPPAEVKNISSGKQYPIVKVHRGTTLNGSDIGGEVCDNTDEIDALIEKFESQLMPSTTVQRKQITDRQHSDLAEREKRAEHAFQNLYNSFNLYLKDRNNNVTKLLTNLKTLNDFLANNQTKFLILDTLAKADCYLLPLLQHIKVAGKAYKDFVIPNDYDAIWRYLAQAYETEAFRESCPADREIILLYSEKASCKPNVPNRRAELMDEVRDFSVPAL